MPTYRIIVNNISTKNTRTKASKARVVKSRSKGSASKKIKSRSEVKQINDAGISVKAAKAIKSKEKAGRQLNPMGIVALINQRLPNIVRKNMKPLFQWRMMINRLNNYRVKICFYS